MSEEKSSKIAVFIDAENISYKNAERIVDILEKKGKILVREIVADWTKINVASKNKDDNITGWRDVAATSSMTAIQQFTYVPKKNSSDIAVVIRAMKTLYEKPYIDIFCIVSNDCDFTRLAQELRENNKYVIGMGRKDKSIEEFIKAFSEYIYLDESLPEKEEEPTEAENTPVEREQEHVIEEAQEYVDTAEINEKKVEKAPATPECIIGNERLTGLIDTIQELIDEKGRALYSAINKQMKYKYPDFVPQNFGCKTFRLLMDNLMSELGMFDLKQTPDDYAFVEKKRKGGKK